MIQLRIEGARPTPAEIAAVSVAVTALVGGGAPKAAAHHRPFPSAPLIVAEPSAWATAALLEGVDAARLRGPAGLLATSSRLIRR